MTIATGHATDWRSASSWRSASACLHADPDLFFPISTTGRALEQIEKAKAVCARCPVLGQCLEFAQSHDPIYGIWGGTTLEDRQRVRRREQRRVRTRERAAAAV
jgi:WhiB family transcriptional regulator, redox-sensing transcriptional regulator